MCVTPHRLIPVRHHVKVKPDGAGAHWPRPATASYGIWSATSRGTKGWVVLDPTGESYLTLKTSGFDARCVR